MPADQTCSLSESGQLRSKRKQLSTGEPCETRECNKPGQFRKNCSVYKKRIAEKGNNPKGEKDETTVGVQGAMVERWKHSDKDCIFMFEDKSEC